jgi:proton-coupled amino acid transporter
MIVVGIVVAITIGLGDKLDKFVAILGSLCCTPIAFMFPSIFHYKACAETTRQKFIDLSIFGFGVAVMIYCTIQGVLNWNK